MAALALTGFVTVGAFAVVVSAPAQAQFDNRYPSLRSQRPQRPGGFFESLFGGGRQRYDEREVAPPRERDRDRGDREQAAPADSSKAPAPRKEVNQGEVTTSIVVLGDSMADWLASGLEDAFGDAPEIGILRKNRQGSGLLRYDPRNDQDGWHVAREVLANEKPSYVVMMLGVSDRQSIRERDVKEEAPKPATAAAVPVAAAAAGATPNTEPNAATAASDAAKKTDAKQADTKQNNDDEASIVAPEPKAQTRRGNGVLEFRTDGWEKVYTRRIDDTIASLKSKGVPVFWVGLPPIRGTRSTSETQYLNDLYRGRAEKAGATYIDVWDGFVDEGNRFTTFGPDYEGQMRRLRSADGVFFTRFGARKLAHYVEREIRRVMTNRGPIALPMGPTAPLPADAKSAARPLAGPVVPLTASAGGSDELLGGSGGGNARADATALSVLVKGDAVAPPAGRADDFVWPPGSERKPAPVATTPAAAPQSAAVTPAAPVAPTMPPAAQPPAAAAATSSEPSATSIVAPEPVAKPRQAEPLRPQQRAVENRQRQQQFERPRAPAPQQQPQRRRDDGGLFGLFR